MAEASWTTGAEGKARQGKTGGGDAVSGRTMPHGAVEEVALLVAARRVQQVPV